ncbi:hypothetical protein [Iningainema tapete]|uniref:Uncharacterized protein n=1 Tax=Iningainema tapete BLCC-T55 TaxID=2748662 RepID=A0A8J6XGM7_9CYAN|nr:hypothetical protein [Iningainema tapete]MBD2773903.1 hypothetical protein [Iningainema tapete BLCC-T55]
MNTQELKLYQRIQQFSLDEIDAKLSFTQRLARDNNWTTEYAQRVIEEYKKFAFLAVVADHPVTPSDQVDQVWHLHLLYTRSYWEYFCPHVLQMPLHHNPTKGGQHEGYKFNDWYSKTLASYERFFQQPPADIWLPHHIRFGRDIHFVRVNTKQNWIIQKSDFSFLSKFRFRQGAVWMLSLLALICIITWDVPAFASFPNPINRSLPEFFNFYLLVGGIGILFIGILGFLLQRFRNDLRTASVLFAILMFVLFSLGTFNLATGILNLSGKDFIGFYILCAIASFLFDFALRRWIKAKPSTYPSGINSVDYTPSWSEFLQTNKAHLDGESIANWLTLLSIFCLYSLGIARIIIGLYRHKPVGYLVILCLCMGVYLLWLLGRENDKFNSVIQKSIYLIVWLSGIILFFLGARILIWVILALIFLIIIFSRGGSHTSSGSSSLEGGDTSSGGCGDGGCGGCGGCGG